MNVLDKIVWRTKKLEDGSTELIGEAIAGARTVSSYLVNYSDVEDVMKRDVQRNIKRVLYGEIADKLRELEITLYKEANLGFGPNTRAQLKELQKLVE
jgi:hypothetical protein